MRKFRSEGLDSPQGRGRGPWGPASAPMGGNPRFWLAAQNRAAGGKKCFPPFPAGLPSLTTRPPNKTKKPPEKLFWVFWRQGKLAAAADGGQAGAGQGASGRERRARELPPEGERRGSTGEPASREAWPEARRAEGAELGWGPQRSRLAGAPVTQRKICGADPGAQLQLAAACARRLRGFPKRSIES